jgi:hypothetical protein
MKIAAVLLLAALSYALIISCTGESGADSNWKFVANIPDENEIPVSVYMDLKSIERNDNNDIRKFWIRYDAYKSGKSGEKFTRQTGYWEVNCFDRALYRLGEEYYNTEGMISRGQDFRHGVQIRRQEMTLRPDFPPA